MSLMFTENCYFLLTKKNGLKLAIAMLFLKGRSVNVTSQGERESDRDLYNMELAECISSKVVRHGEALCCSGLF